MMLVHAEHRESVSPSSHAAPGYVAPVSSVRPFILRERPDVVAARLSRKRWVRESLFAVHGTLKREYLASLLGHASHRYVVKCLSDAHPDELSEVHCLKLGIAGLRSGEAQ